MRFKLAWFGDELEGDEPVKRRDHIKHQLQGGYENYQKERREDTRTLEQRIEDMRTNYFLLFNKFIVAPLLFCKDQVLVKHLILPIKKTPCIPNKSVEDEDDDERALKEYFGDEPADDDGRNVLSAGPVVPHEESFFLKYIARPIEKSPCMPADSDDEEDYHAGDHEEEEEDEEGGDTPVKKEPKDKAQHRRGLSSLLGDSVWTKIQVKPEKPGEEKVPEGGEEEE
jgi:hypothetical protein